MYNTSLAKDVVAIRRLKSDVSLWTSVVEDLSYAVSHNALNSKHYFVHSTGIVHWKHAAISSMAGSAAAVHLDTQNGAKACKPLVQVELVCSRGQVLDVQGCALLLCAKVALNRSLPSRESAQDQICRALDPETIC